MTHILLEINQQLCLKNEIYSETYWDMIFGIEIACEVEKLY